MSLTVSQGIRLVTEQQAERELLADGFVKATCASCKGAKFFEHPSNSVGEGLSAAKYRNICRDCEGQGWVWQSPPPNPHTKLSCSPVE